MARKSLTIIIPVYNAEKYIAECIESIIKQEDSGIIERIIVVVDGATDNTWIEVKKALSKAKIDTKLILQENLGPSAARNNGMRYVETKYVTFLDADDLWTPNFCQSISPLIKESPDLIEYDAFRMNDRGVILNTIKIAKAESGLIKNIDKNDFLSVFRCYAWARVYKTELIKEKLFPEDRRFEDTATTPWYYWNSKKIISIGKPLIAYRQHSSSILATPKLEDVFEIIRCIADAAEIYKKTNDNYWRIVVYRIFHFACQRITKQPFRQWKKCINSALSAVDDIPPPTGFLRKLQREETLMYVFLLYVRYSVSDFSEKIIPKIILQNMFPER